MVYTYIYIYVTCNTLVIAFIFSFYFFYYSTQKNSTCRHSKWIYSKPIKRFKEKQMNILFSKRTVELFKSGLFKICSRYIQIKIYGTEDITLPIVRKRIFKIFAYNLRTPHTIIMSTFKKKIIKKNRLRLILHFLLSTSNPERILLERVHKRHCT